MTRLIEINSRALATIAITLAIVGCKPKDVQDTEDEPFTTLPQEEISHALAEQDASGEERLYNESARDLTLDDITRLKKKSDAGVAYASDVLAQEALRKGRYREAANWESKALMQGSLNQHRSLSTLFAIEAEKWLEISIPETCVFWERAIWHSQYVIDNVEEDAALRNVTDKAFIEEERATARLQIQDIVARRKSLEMDSKCKTK